ncbi:MAG: DNA translocase FtsK 4TM domain-containing protein [Deltaproteobacteria bacterium]|nr:DNA translocase FtsK 4TM domain-containing protein [Deltaproteobacteria bacterium]
MANKRRAAAPRKAKDQTDHKRNPRRNDKPGIGSKALHEAIAVSLGCSGLLTVLALWSYNAGDASLNASGTADVHNWIGPAGAYWADMLFQLLGVGAYALGLGALFASVRAFSGRRVRPGFREAAGTVLMVVCVGAFAHLVLFGVPRPYPAGGVVGAILAQVLLEKFAKVGAYVLSGALVMTSVTLTADGILSGLGLKGLGALSHTFTWARATAVLFAERHRAKRERLQQLVPELPEAADDWTMGAAALPDKAEASTAAKLEEARARGRKLGEAEAVEEMDLAKARALRDVSEPEIELDQSVDLAAEEDFEIGALPPLDQIVNPGAAAVSDEPVVELEPDDVEMDIAIRAATPEAALRLAISDLTVDDTQEVPIPTFDEMMRPATAAPKSGLSSTKKKRHAEPEIVDVRPQVDAAAIERAAAEKVDETPRQFTLPSATLLDFQESTRAPIDAELLRDNAVKLTKTLKEYGIDGHVREIRPGPVVTMYEFVPAPGIKLSRIASLADDLAMSMAALRVRIVAPIPGKGAVGIEIPNESREMVYLKEMIAHDNFRKAKAKLTLALGKDIEGNATVANLAKMPHLLVAGTTGTGKSVSINSMIMSILFKATPDDVRMIMVDPKMLELSVYDGIPHLLLPVVTDPKKASLALRWAVEEMGRRYNVLSELGVRSIDGYNQKLEDAAKAGEEVVLPPETEGGESRVLRRMPYIVVVVDEFADLMMVAGREVEASIMRLAQMARAAGIHLILATQRPSVDVITGVIKANFPTRVAFQVASKHDSRTIIDQNGAEHLLGRGDMLYLSPGAGGLCRVHGAFVSDEEIDRTVKFLRAQGTPQYDESILAPREEAEAGEENPADKDEMYDQAVAIVAETRQASISMIQRRLRIGYNRAARLVEVMEKEGIVGPADGAKPREVFVSPAPM